MYQRIELIYIMFYKVWSIITLTIKQIFYAFQGWFLEKKAVGSLQQSYTQAPRKSLDKWTIYHK